MSPPLLSSVPVLETERLRLRAWREDDLGPFVEFCAREATARFVGGVCNRGDAWRRIALQVGHWVLRGYGPWALEDKADGRWVGYSGLWNPEGWPEPELMWGLAARCHHRGYATEAAQRGREFAYCELGWKTLASYIAAENKASQRVAQRLGATLERTIDLRGWSQVGVYRHPNPGASQS
jgi:RimJ/RimL family protein N-acetyltransferase